MPLVSMQPLMYIYFINATETWKFDKKYEKLLKYIAFSVIPIWMLSLLGSGGCLKNLNVLSSACGDFTGMLIGWTGHIGWSFKANILFTFGWFLYVLTIVGTIGYKSLTTFFFFTLYVCNTLFIWSLCRTSFVVYDSTIWNYRY